MRRIVLAAFLAYFLFVSFALCADNNVIVQKIESNRSQVIKKGDLLHITVQGHDDLSMDVIANDNGKIRFPLINEMDVVNRTVGDVIIEMETLLSEFIRYPDVVILFRNTFFVYGEVYRPGEYNLGGHIDILKAVTLAGGFTDFASHKVKIIKSSSKRSAVWVNVDNIIKGKGEDSDILVESGDMIVVPESLF